MKTYVKRAFALTVAAGMLGGGAAALLGAGGDEPATTTTAAAEEQLPGASFPMSDASGWTVGELRPDGLRIVPTPPHDASRVLDPEQFAGQPVVQNAYWIATQIPEVLNQLYCWCGCENRGQHRSNLACFEDGMSVWCEVCRGTAEIAYDMVQNGVTDAARIQAAVDEKWAPPTA